MENLICQSCGMNMHDANELGNNADGSKNQEYCSYCYQDGKFTKDLTMDEMILINVEYLDEYNKEMDVKFTKEEAIEEMKKYFPTLKRWHA